MAMTKTGKSGAKPKSTRSGPVVTGGRPWWKRWWMLLLVFPALILGFVGLIIFFVVFASIPLPEDIATEATVILDDSGNEIGTLNAEVTRTDIELEDLPEHVPQAVLAAEDRAFHEHSGISPTGILRAVFTNTRAGQIEQGGSTITQQYIKNAVVGTERTFMRKVREASLAIKMERQYDKDTILELYLNSIYWGRGAYGIEAAAQTYYGKPAAELNVNEAAVLAGLIRAPERLDPVESPEEADTRRVHVLDGMLDEGWIDEAAHNEAVAGGLPEVSDRAVVNRGPNAYFIDAVRRTLVEQMGTENLYRGLRIHTTVIPRVQEAAVSALSEHLADQEFTGAIVITDPENGAVRALVGGPDIAQQPFNAAIRAYRQVGSSFKTATLAAWIDAGYSVDSRFEGPATYEVPDGTGGTHEVRNYGDSSYGNVTVERATESSINTVYVQMQEELGAENVIEMAARLGLPTERAGTEGAVMPAVPTLTLGVAGFSPLEMAGAYATLAANGVRSTPHLVTGVENLDGVMVWEPDVNSDRVMEEDDAARVTEVLEGVVRSGTGTAAAIGRPAAGKTGTTNDNRNAWFAGYTPQLAAAVWIGNGDNSPMDNITGGSVPARVWAAAMAAAHEGLEVEDFPSVEDEGEVLNERPDECADGFARREPPNGVDDNGWYPDIQEDSEDSEGRPCVELSPEPEPSPTPTETETETETESPSPTPSPTETESPTPSPSPSPSPSPTEDETESSPADIGP